MRGTAMEHYARSDRRQMIALRKDCTIACAALESIFGLGVSAHFLRALASAKSNAHFNPISPRVTNKTDIVTKVTVKREKVGEIFLGGKILSEKS